MLLSRILGTVGRAFITLGVMTLLFVAYQLWGTGLLTAQAQAELEDEFAELLEQAETSGVSDILADGAGEQAAGSDTAVAEPAVDGDDELTPAEATARLELAKLLWRPDGEAVAQILIPDIDVSQWIVSGVGVEALRKGPGHYRGTPLPGMEGNAAVAGHRTTWGAPFNRIDELDPGDQITVRTVQGVFIYEVVAQQNGKGHFIVSPDRVDVLDQDFEDHPNRLTLTACHPKFSARQRIIVVAELVGEPAEFIPRPAGVPEAEAGLASEDVGEQPATGDVTDGGLPGDPELVETVPTATPTTMPADDEAAAPTTVAGGASAEPSPPSSPAADEDAAATDDFGEGLNGDRGAILPAVMWGIAASAIWIAARQIGQRWRRWPSYAAAVVPFAVVLFVCFVNIDKALPSY